MDDNKKINSLKSGDVIEETPYTKKELKEIFPYDDKTFAEIIRQMRVRKLLKINRSNKITLDMSDATDEIVDVDDAVRDVDGYRYTFTCVGIIVIGDFLLRCYPKYIHNVVDEKELLGKMKQIIKVLDRYNASRININKFSDSYGDKSFNLLESILFFLHDYYENGIYTNQHIVIEHNGLGDVLWDKTVNQTQPIFVKNRPYYMDLITRKRENENENYFMRLHKCILSDCSKKLKMHNLFDLFDSLSPVEFDCCSLVDFGNIDYILYRIERELSEQFNSRKQRLLKTMYTYISRQNGKYDTVALSVYATTNFNLVWEDVCKVVLNNDLNETLDALSKKSIGFIHSDYEDKRNDTLGSIIEKPQWVTYDANGIIETSQRAEKTLEPDIISTFKLGEIKYFAIFDAKYYKVQFSPKLIGQPGVGDITKQYLYNLVYKDFIEKHNFDRVWNCFLLPYDSDSFVKKGYTNLNILSFFNMGAKNQHYKNAIDIIFMPASIMFKWYLNGVRGDKRLYYKVLNMIDSDEYGRCIVEE